MIMRVLAIANQKGGVGKTTTSVNLAASLALTGSRVLLLDLDPQGNATMGCGVDKNAVDASVYDWLIEQRPLAELVVTTEAGFDLMPGNGDLTSAEIELLDVDQRERRLAAGLARRGGVV